MTPFSFTSLKQAIDEVKEKTYSEKMQEELEPIEEATNMFTDDRVGFQIDRFAGKSGQTFQINYGRGKGKHIQIPKSDMKRVITQMTKAMNAKQEITVKDFFELRKHINEEQFGTFFIKFEGIKNPSKVDTAYERETQYTFGALMEDADIEMDGEPEFAGNVLKVYADKSEMKNINKFLNARNKLAKDTQAMMKKGAKVLSTKEIEKLYEKRADHFYVTAVLGKMANPNTTPKYSIQKFMKEN